MSLERRGELRPAPPRSPLGCRRRRTRSRHRPRRAAAGCPDVPARTHCCYETPETLLRKSTVAARAGVATKTAMTSSAKSRGIVGLPLPALAVGAAGSSRNARSCDVEPALRRAGRSTSGCSIGVVLLDQVSSDEKLTEHHPSFSAETWVPGKSRMHRERCVDGSQPRPALEIRRGIDRPVVPQSQQLVRVNLEMEVRRTGEGITGVADEAENVSSPHVPRVKHPRGIA